MGDVLPWLLLLGATFIKKFTEVLAGILAEKLLSKGKRKRPKKR
jgi:hypothetical protein